MTDEQQTSPSAAKSMTVNPWIVAAAALIIYGLALNHWVTLRGLPWIASVTGWDWHPIPTEWRPSYFAPLWYVTTLPFRVLPVTWQPCALNLFSAVCASLTLMLLAQSVRLLPHDRTREQRQREPGEFSLFSGKWAFVPQVFAVVMLGLQGVFWENAVTASNEMLDVLVFAFIIYCLLRFRISQNEKWLAGMALVYGLGTTNNFALVGFFPFFLIALIWIKGLSFFNVRFMLRMIGFGLLGLLLYLLIPLRASLASQNFGLSLWQELKQESFLLRIVPGWIPLVASLSTIAPLLCAGFKWPEIEGELSAVGNAVTRLTFMAMNVLFLPVCLLMFFDWRFSTNPHVHDAPVPFLTFYYLAALAVGYYSGYILIVFGKRSLQRAKFKESPAVKKTVLAYLVILTVGAPALLLGSNWDRIRSSNNGILSHFTEETIAALPAQTTVVMSDDPIRLQLLEAGYARAGKTNPHILLETGAMPYREYYAHLVDKYPELKKKMAPIDKFPEVLPQTNMVDFVFQLGRDYAIYYLHPSFGYYFEQFYLRPHRLVYELKSYTGRSSLAPLPSAAEIADNQEYWKKTAQTTLASLSHYSDSDWDVGRVSVDYSVALDFWGVELQRANKLPEAHAAFAEAYKVNTNNLMAEYNMEYNERLQHGDSRPLGQSDTLARAISLYRSVPAIIKYNGPPDEPDVDMIFGQTLAQGGNLRQAAGLFERRLQLLPNDIPAKMAVAKTLVDTGQADRALELTRQVRAQTNMVPDELFWVEAVAYLSRTNFGEAERSLLQGQAASPKNPVRLANVMEFYRRTGLAALAQGRRDDGAARLHKALQWSEKFIQLVSEDKSAATRFPLADVLMIKADIEVNSENDAAAVQTLTRVIELDPDNENALLNRALVLMRQKKFAAAQDDAEAMRKVDPERAFMAYGVEADIAKSEQNVANQKKYLGLYLKATPADSEQHRVAKKELDKIEGH
ncbi:MAG TPA: DUF2723 domain-containing protein [Verrucomicrobiae bacterium]|jgi:tetratricopeptide (TPR) repeat protein|nr:DUF2723 domain-containing protein [Verrucomicrobiae bacterium]